MQTWAQTPSENPDIGSVEYKHEFSMGGGIHSRGWHLSANYAKYLGADARRLIQLEFVEIRHPKEQKQSSEYNLESYGYNPPKQYAFGKAESLFNLHLSIGSKNVIGDKADRNGLSIQYQYLIGPTLGLAKPYYLEIIESNDSPQGFGVVDHKYNPEDPLGNNFLDQSFIYGSSGFWKGFGEMRFIPGLHAKGGFSFDWGKTDKIIKSVDVGLSGDYLFNAPRLLANEDNKPVFFYIYLGLQFGKRW